MNHEFNQSWGVMFGTLSRLSSPWTNECVGLIYSPIGSYFSYVNL